MKVQIEGNLYLESDEYQFVIKEYTGKQSEKGVDIYKTLAYVTDPDQAFRFLLKQKIKESTAENVQELVAEFRRIEDWLRKLFAVEAIGV